MQAIKLPLEFQFTTKKSANTTCQGYIFSNKKEGKAVKMGQGHRAPIGIPVISVHDSQRHLLIGLCREGPNLLRLNMFSLTSFKLLKRIAMANQQNSINSRYILRSYSANQKVVYYHESHANIEVRSSVTLKLRSSYSLSEICQEIGLSDMFSELKTSLDLDYIPHLSSLVMLLGPKIALMDDKKAKQLPTVIYENTTLENYRSINYDENRKIMLGVGTFSFLLVGFNDTGVSYTKTLSSNLLGKTSRMLCWNPAERMIVLSQRTTQKAENFHFLCYKDGRLTHTASVLNLPPYGNCYDEDSQLLLFMEGDDRNRYISSISLRDFNDRIEDLDKPVELEGEIFAFLPPSDHYHDTYFIKFVRDTLIIKPRTMYEDEFVRRL